MGLPEQSLGTLVNFPWWTNEGPSGPAGISPLRASLYPSWQDFSHAGCLHGVTGKIPLLSNISKIISLDRLPIPSIKIFLEDKVLLLQHITPRAGENFATHFWNLALSGFPPTYLSNNPSKREEASYFPLGSFYVPLAGSPLWHIVYHLILYQHCNIGGSFFFLDA